MSAQNYPNLSEAERRLLNSIPHLQQTLLTSSTKREQTPSETISTECRQLMEAWQTSSKSTQQALENMLKEKGWIKRGSAWLPLNYDLSGVY